MLKAFYHDSYPIPLPAGHRFPGGKYSQLRQRLMDEHELHGIELLQADAATDNELLLVHTYGYVSRFRKGEMTDKEMRRIGFPWSPELVVRSVRSVGSTIAASRAALTYGIAVNLGGGTHHAYADHGEGFCVFNDVAIAARQMQRDGLAQRILIVDCDVHQGNGTAAIFKDDSSVFTFSIHGLKNFPYHKECSNLDIALPDGVGDTEYLLALNSSLSYALKHANADFIVYLAGADPYTGDTLGRLSLSKAGLEARDRMVLEVCRYSNLPVVITMAGGYGKDINDTVDIHINTIRVARDSIFPNGRNFPNDTA